MGQSLLAQFGLNQSIEIYIFWQREDLPIRTYDRWTWPIVFISGLFVAAPAQERYPIEKR